MNETATPYTVLNEDVSDDKEPFLYIQRYEYPKRIYQVIRKQWDEETEGEFEPNPEYETKYWQVSFLLLDDREPPDETDDYDDSETEVFAVVYRDEENPPVDDPDEIEQNNDPCFLVVYDPKRKLYLCESTGCFGDEVVDFKDEDETALNQVAKPTLRATINAGVALLDCLIEHSSKM